MVAVSEFHAGAMENFGLIVYRENELLYNEKTSTANRKQIVSCILCAFSLLLQFISCKIFRRLIAASASKKMKPLFFLLILVCFSLFFFLKFLI